MDANLDLMDIEMIEISFQSLIDANHINCDAQKRFFEEIANMQKLDSKKIRIIIYKYT